MMEFLYFPEDKTEYIPAAIMCFVFIFGAVITLMLFMKNSRKQEKILKQQEQQILANNDSNSKSTF